jgi:hypothetical protein
VAIPDFFSHQNALEKAGPLSSLHRLYLILGKDEGYRQAEYLKKSCLNMSD